MIRLFIYGFLIYVAYRLLKSWGKSLLGAGEDLADVSRDENTELIRDPQCGTYFLRQQGVEGRVDGQRLFFCSEQCRAAYMREHKIT